MSVDAKLIYKKNLNDIFDKLVIMKNTNDGYNGLNKDNLNYFFNDLISLDILLNNATKKKKELSKEQNFNFENIKFNKTYLFFCNLAIIFTILGSTFYKKSF